MTKTCNKCGETKPLAEFHKRLTSKDGHRGHCKGCQKVIAKSWCEANKERKAAAEKAWRKANPDAVKTHRERKKERWPDKITARKAVSDAIRSGTLVRQPCEVCGSTEVHGHHDDYRQPLVVRWLCPVHHTEHHYF